MNMKKALPIENINNKNYWLGFSLFQLKATLLLCIRLMRSATEHLAASKFLNIYLQSSQVACRTNKKHQVYSHAHNFIHMLNTNTH